MAISDSAKAKLNKMNRAAQDAALGTAVQTAQVEVLALQGLAVKAGVYTMIAADQTAGTKAIATGLGKTISGFIVQIYRSNVAIASATITKSTATLTIATNGSDYVVTTGDVVNYIVW